MSVKKGVHLPRNEMKTNRSKTSNKTTKIASPVLGLASSIESPSNEFETKLILILKLVFLRDLLSNHQCRGTIKDRRYIHFIASMHMFNFHIKAPVLVSFDG